MESKQKQFTVWFKDIHERMIFNKVVYEYRRHNKWTKAFSEGNYHSRRDGYFVRFVYFPTVSEKTVEKFKEDIRDLSDCVRHIYNISMDKK